MIIDFQKACAFFSSIKLKVTNKNLKIDKTKMMSDTNFKSLSCVENIAVEMVNKIKPANV